ncbi:MAG: acetylxylan esterase [Paludibacteraceae bacterium]|nr:acetylxylan esterase [Paludibacteraceae bacterium]
MKKTMLDLFVILLSLSLMSCKDKNQPSSPQDDPVPPREYKECTGTVTSRYHDFVWEDEQPSIEVNVTNPNPYDTTVAVKLYIYSGNVYKIEVVDTITRTFRVGKNATTQVYVSPSKPLEPEFYRAMVQLNGKTIQTKLAGGHSGKFNIGVSPKKIVSPYDGQSDYDEFWANTKSELRAIYKDHEVKLTKVKEVNNSTIYFFEARSLKNMGDTLGYVRGYYSEPNAEGKYPCYIQFPGYDTPGASFSCPLYGNATRCEMHVSPRGQYANAHDPYHNEYGEWIKYGIDSKEHYYYRGAFMDAVRAVDFAFSRAKVDTTQVFAYGSSQGGALTLAAAALSDHHFAAISPCVPFLGDWHDFFKLSMGFPQDIRNAAKKAGMSEEEALRVISYIDTKNLAHLITCPVLEVYCLQDEVCPPHTNVSIYNNLDKCPDKELHVSPLENHAWAENWDQLRNAFFRKYTK